MSSLLDFKYFFIVLLSAIALSAMAQEGQVYNIAKVDSYFPNWEEVNNHNIEWKALSVPENWGEPKKKIKLAVAKLNSHIKTQKTIVYVSGGPGGWSIGSIKKWLYHPIRKEVNIILVDLRGTGFSEPLLCPDLGEQLFEVFSADGNTQKDIENFVNVGEECRRSIVKRKIDMREYNSISVANDLNALRKSLGIHKWFVYGVSYGTWIAQVYSKIFPETLEGLILDSPIADINQYYSNNTHNYERALQTLFTQAKASFPELAFDYNSVIKELEHTPLKIPLEIGKKNSEFIVNTNDFKIIIHQSLYNHTSLEVLPFIIRAFKNKDKVILQTLIESLSGNLKRDFGTYYSMTCNDVYTDSSIVNFGQSEGRISFYNSDLYICKDWELKQKEVQIDSSKEAQQFDYSTLIFAGKFDPITPLKNGKKLSSEIPNSYLLAMPGGHASGNSPLGREAINLFLKDPSRKPLLKKTPKEISFIQDIHNQEGIINVLKPIKTSDFLIFAPFIIALLVVFISIIITGKNLLSSKCKQKILNGLIFISSLMFLITAGFFVWGLINTISVNHLIPVFGILSKYAYTIDLIYIYIPLFTVTFLYFAINFKAFRYKEALSTVIFSLSLLIIYFLHWGII
jgi:pimeloyl-ACP methyl ester carboxylesterase